MSLPKILYNNILEGATITCTIEDTNYPASNIGDWLPYTRFKPNTTGTADIIVDALSSVTADCIGIYSYGSQLTTEFNLYYGSSASGPWTQIPIYSYATIMYGFDPITITQSGRVIMREFDSTTSRYWKIEVTNVTTATYIGVIAIGEALEIPRGLPSGFTPPHMDKRDAYTNSNGDTGILLGRSVIRKSGMLSFTIKALTPSWVRTYWEPFLTHTETKPFFFWWNTEYENDGVFCVTRKYKPPKYADAMYMSVSLDSEAWNEL